MMLGLAITLAGARVKSGNAPIDPLPADAYQEPIAEGDEGYWRYQDEGYYQEPEP